MLRDRRSVRAVLLSTAIALFVVGCGSDDKDSAATTAVAAATTVASAATDAEPTTAADTAPETTAAVEAATITYLASQNWVLESEKELAAKFEDETGIHVDYQIIPADQYFSVLQTKLEAGGEGIDIFGGQSGKTDIQLQLGVEKNAVPVTDEEWVARMDPLSTEQISLDGVVYGQTIWDTVGGSWVVVYLSLIHISEPTRPY